ncbi:MAG: hypothetical protein BWK79_03010 [Beggiatoa sp. IS2]|nr:MAG: hypothetical protein BWK79_03010 [Beggiatoa sp. IS2]
MGGKLDYFMEGSSPLGLYYTRGQLMESSMGSAYIDFDVINVGTIGELHHVNYYCLQRINYLEFTSAEFPKGYELSVIPVWVYEEPMEVLNLNFHEGLKSIAFCYRRREDSRVISGDWINRKSSIEEIGSLLKEETKRTLYHNDVIKHMMTYLEVDK